MRETGKSLDVFPRLRATWLGVFGIPNYDAYLRACARPTRTGRRSGEAKFLAWKRSERRYARRGPRCC
jgi:hypothetical protein